MAKEGITQKEVLQRLTSPEDLNHIMHVLNPQGWAALLLVLLMIALSVSWAIFGSLSIEVEGRGILLTPGGVFEVRIPSSGIVTEILANPGQSVTTETVIARLLDQDHNQVIEIKSPQSGKVIELLVRPGDYLSTGSPVVTAHHALKEGERLVCRSFFPVAEGQKIAIGMPARIRPDNVSAQQFGYLLGNISYNSQFPVSDVFINQIVLNEHLVDYLKAGAAVVTYAEVTPTVSDKTVSGYAWSSPDGPPFQMEPGIICTVDVELEKRSPISFLFPKFSKPQKQ